MSSRALLGSYFLPISGRRPENPSVAGGHVGRIQLKVSLFYLKKGAP